MTIALRAVLSAVLLVGAVTGLSLPNPDTLPHHGTHELAKLRPMSAPMNFMCRNSNQRMSCYGGIPVTLATCMDVCTCEDGRVSCPTYKYCDDSTMDTFCGSLCACTISMPSRLRANDDTIVISPHRQHASTSTSKRLLDDEEDVDVDEDEDQLFRRDEDSYARAAGNIPAA